MQEVQAALGGGEAGLASREAEQRGPLRINGLSAGISRQQGESGQVHKA